MKPITERIYPEEATITVGYKDKKSIMTRMTRKRDRVGLKF